MNGKTLIAAALATVLAADPRVTANLDAGARARLLDPLAYTGLCAELAREAAARARAMSTTITEETLATGRRAQQQP